MANKITTKRTSDELSKKQLILNKIKETPYGINITQIADALNMHRITVKKYVEELESENNIMIQQFGNTKICYPIVKAKKLNTYQPVILNIFATFFKSFGEVISPSIEDVDGVMKLMGKSMSTNLNLPEMKSHHLVDLSNDKKVVLEQIADMGLDYVKFFNEVASTQGYENFIIANKQKLIETDEEVAQSLKVEFKPFEFLDSGLFYHFCAGFFEAIIQETFDNHVYFNVHMIPPEKFVCYYKISMR